MYNVQSNNMELWKDLASSVWYSCMKLTASNLSKESWVQTRSSGPPPPPNMLLFASFFYCNTINLFTNSITYRFLSGKIFYGCNHIFPTIFQWNTGAAWKCLCQNLLPREYSQYIQRINEVFRQHHTSHKLFDANKRV